MLESKPALHKHARTASDVVWSAEVIVGLWLKMGTGLSSIALRAAPHPRPGQVQRLWPVWPRMARYGPRVSTRPYESEQEGGTQNLELWC